MKTKATFEITGPATVTVTVEGGQPDFLPNCTTFQGPGGVDQLDPTEMAAGVYCFDHAEQGIKFCRLSFGTPPITPLPAGMFFPCNPNPQKPAYWATR